MEMQVGPRVLHAHSPWPGLPHPHVHPQVCNSTNQKAVESYIILLTYLTKTPINLLFQSILFPTSGATNTLKILFPWCSGFSTTFDFINCFKSSGLHPAYFLSPSLAHSTLFLVTPELTVSVGLIWEPPNLKTKIEMAT